MTTILCDECTDKVLDRECTRIRCVGGEIDLTDAEAMQKDAERYRWLRDIAGNQILDDLKILSDPREFDAAIDAGIKAHEAEQANA